MEKLFHRHIKIISPATVKMLFILICETCNNFYLGQTQDFNQRIVKHKSDVNNPHNSTCRICSEHPRLCNLAKPYFQIFLFYYEANAALRKHKEK